MESVILIPHSGRTYGTDTARQRTPSEERVAWVITQNLATHDPELAAKIMSATAALSKRCAKACLHTIIAWHPDEQPSPQAMQEIALRTLSLAGLAEH
jgi:hypothetical protein